MSTGDTGENVAPRTEGQGKELTRIYDQQLIAQWAEISYLTGKQGELFSNNGLAKPRVE